MPSTMQSSLSVSSSDMSAAKSLDDAILYFALRYPSCESMEVLQNDMLHHQCFDPEHIHQVTHISTIAWGRFLFQDMGIKYPKTIIRARDDGSVEPDVDLDSLPAYARAMALVDKIQRTLSRHAFRVLCMYNAESRAIVRAIKALGQGLDLREITMYPVVVPDLHVHKETVQRAFDVVNRLRQLHWPTGSTCRRTWRFNTTSEQHI
jgi:hypothetical protein